jgi:hypothetical protein
MIILIYFISNILCNAYLDSMEHQVIPGIGFMATKVGYNRPIRNSFLDAYDTVDSHRYCLDVPYMLKKQNNNLYDLHCKYEHSDFCIKHFENRRRYINMQQYGEDYYSISPYVRSYRKQIISDVEALFI